VTLAIAAPLAGAAKSVVGSFGTLSFEEGGGGQFNEPQSLAVNNSSGDINVVDNNKNRIQRFDALHNFLGAWGFDTIQSGKPGDLGEEAFEVCTLAADCKEGIASVSPAPGGELSSPQGIAVDQSTGNVYVTNGEFRRVDEFSATGNFIRAFGQNVVQSGKPDNVPVDEQQTVTIKADSGQFRLAFAADTTGNLPYNASATEVQTELNGLASINSGGGSVSVSGPNGGPYIVTFDGGPLADTDVPTLTINSSLLGIPVGTQLTCAGGPSSAATQTFQWLRNGEPIGGATAATYTTVAADEGEPVQCQFFAINANAGATQVSNPATVVTPFPATAPPVAPTISAPSSATLTVGGVGGQTITCNPNSAGWTGSPTFTYQWYRNGVPLAGATNPTYIATAADVATRAVFQCAVTGTNASGSVTKVSANKATSPAPSAPAAPVATSTVPSPSTVLTTTNAGEAFEICAVAADCQGGSSGTIGGAFGIIDTQLAIAPASAPNAGDVLVADRGNRRVSEYTSAGAFVRTFGFDVVASGPDDTGGGEFEVCKAGIDVCKAAAPSGSGVGQFGENGPVRVAEDSTDAIYTIESRPPNLRVQKFTLPGNVVTPQGVFAEGVLSGTSESTSPTNIAIEGSGNVLVTKGFPAGATPECLNSRSPSVNEEQRLLVLSPAGALIDTHLACAGIERANGLAVNPASGRVYLASSFPANTAQVYVLDDVTPPAATIEPVAEFDAFSATLKGHVNPQGSLAECRFDYITKAAYEANPSGARFSGAAEVPCESNPGGGTGPIAVGAIASLAPNTAYKVRLVAFKPVFGDVATASPTEEVTSAAEPPPTVITGAVAPKGTTTARLSGLVNPNGSSTEVHFEYGADGDCETSLCLSTEPEDVGSAYIPPGFPFTPVTIDLKELEPETTYHYRLVGINDTGTNAGIDRTFTTLSGEEPVCPNEDVRQKQHTDSYLGSCRGIELINNPDKGNQNVFSQFPDIATPAMTPDGERVLWYVTSGAPGGTASAGNTFLAERTESGWKSRNLIPAPAQQFGGAELPYLAEQGTPDFGTFVFNVGSSALFVGKTLVRLDREQHQEVLASYEEGVEANKGEITDDAAHVVVINPDTKQLEDIGKPGEPEVLSLMPDESPSECGLAVGGGVTGASFTGWSGSREAAGAHWNSGYRMMDTNDASRVYFEVKPNGNCGGRYGLYVRNRETEETTQIDPGTASHNVEFIRATPDGRHAYFATYRQLDPADENNGADVYRWDEGSGESTCLTCVVANASIDFFQLSLRSILVSDDFSHIYFQSKQQLVAGHGKTGTVNTYALSGGAIHFVAGEGVENLETGTGGAQAQLSADGNVLVFKSALELAGGVQNLTADSFPGECLNRFDALKPCQELYRYDDRDGSLECISCRHDGETTFSIGPPAGEGSDFAMSADGSTVAFATRQALIPQDVNQGTDVYEWRDGAVHLISDGLRTYQKELAAPRVRGVGADGRNILFSLAAPGLTGFEQDGVANLYDARVGGGFVPPIPPVHCAEDSCQGPLQAAPSLDKAGSSGSSRGNVVESGQRQRPCARKRGKAKRRCIRKHKRRLQKTRANRNAGRLK
jgi:hypothetical protein